MNKISRIFLILSYSLIVIILIADTPLFLSILDIKDIPIAIAYASWGGLGIFLITLLGYIFYGQMLQWQSVLGLAFIALGVAIVNIYKT